MKYILGLEDGRNEPIKNLDNTKRIVLVDTGYGRRRKYHFRLL